MGRACKAHGELRYEYKTLDGMPKGKKPLWSPRHRWEDNIKMDLMETGVDDMDWNHLAQDWDWWQALVNMVINLWIP
jgi:hypothetical protein